MKKGPNLPRRAWPMVLAACAHLLALLWLGWRIPELIVPSQNEDRNVAMEVTLVRPPVRVRVRPRAEAVGPAPSTPHAPAHVLVTPAPGAQMLSAPAPSSPAPVQAQAEASPDGQKLRNALRGLVGCADAAAYRLSREERAACDQRLATARSAPVGPQFSAQELAEFNADKTYNPLLVRKPHKGCLPRLANTPPPFSLDPNVTSRPRPERSGAETTFGAGCAWSF